MRAMRWLLREMRSVAGLSFSSPPNRPRNDADAMIADSGVRRVVREHRHQHLVGLEQLLGGFQLFGQLLLLPGQLHEYIDLGRQHARVDRLEQEIDRAGGASRGTPRAVLAGRRREQDGDMAGALAARISSASSKPSISGTVHVEDGQPEVVLEQQFQRLRAGVGVDDLHIGLGQHGIQRREVGGDVVDGEDLDRSLHEV